VSHGLEVGESVRPSVGKPVGYAVGTSVGVLDGAAVGLIVGVAEGEGVSGLLVGAAVGVTVGSALGALVGASGCVARHFGKNMSICVLICALLYLVTLPCGATSRNDTQAHLDTHGGQHGRGEEGV
jgi:hypothetical protein